LILALVAVDDDAFLDAAVSLAGLPPVAVVVAVAAV
jgi:hypothetical protein